MINDLVERASESTSSRYVLLTGFSKSGKTYQAAQILSARKTLWLSVGETDGYKTALIASADFGVSDFDMIHLERLLDSRQPILALRNLLIDLAKNKDYEAVVVDSIDGIGRWFERALQFSNSKRILTKEGAVKFERDHFGQKKSFLGEVCGYLLPNVSLSGKDVISVCGVANKDIVSSNGAVHTKTVIDLSGSMQVELPRYFSLVCEVRRTKTASVVLTESEDADLGGRLAVPPRMSALDFRNWLKGDSGAESTARSVAPTKAAKPQREAAENSDNKEAPATENPYILQKGDIAANGKYVGVDASSGTLKGWHFIAALADHQGGKSKRDQMLIDLAFDRVAEYVIKFFKRRWDKQLAVASEADIQAVLDELKKQDKAVSKLWLSKIAAVLPTKVKDYGDRDQYGAQRYDT